MKRIILIFAIIVMYTLSGCDSSKVIESTSVEEPVKIEVITVDEVKSDVKASAIQCEIEKVEEKSKAYEDKFQNESMTQTDMNLYSKEWYMLWDDELNLLWDRISEEADSDTKQKLLDEQREWIKRKENNVVESGKLAEGGSLQPQLENGTAEEMTRARSYVLAQELAKIRGEEFVISDDVQKEIADADPSLFDVFKKFEGKWLFNPETGAYIGVQPKPECPFGDDDANWVVWLSVGDVFTDANVISYTLDSINFKIPYDDFDAYYRIEYNFEGSFMLSYGLTEEMTDDIIICDERM